VALCARPGHVGWRKGGRLKLLFFGTAGAELREYLWRAQSWARPNVYHGRGLRFARQRLIKKHGKVSTYR
jgi:hypothetical protein